MRRHHYPLQRIVLCALLLTGGAMVAREQAPVRQDPDTCGYLKGQYELIGRFPDSTKIFRGTARLTFDGTRLHMERTMNGKTVAGTARLDVSGPDRIEVLRAKFAIEGEHYDATYLWRSDLDNYPILTGRVYRKGTKSPGVEALFPVTR